MLARVAIMNEGYLARLVLEDESKKVEVDGLSCALAFSLELADPIHY